MSEFYAKDNIKAKGAGMKAKVAGMKDYAKDYAEFTAICLGLSYVLFLATADFSREESPAWLVRLSDGSFVVVIGIFIVYVVFSLIFEAIFCIKRFLFIQAETGQWNPAMFTFLPRVNRKEVVIGVTTILEEHGRIIYKGLSKDFSKTETFKYMLKNKSKVSRIYIFASEMVMDLSILNEEMIPFLKAFPAEGDKDEIDECIMEIEILKEDGGFA